MLSAWIPLVLAMLVLAMIPFGLKWLQRRFGAGVAGTTGLSKVISAVAVGPHQRVVTVEVGPAQARVWLTLGVTAQSITCLHTQAAGPEGVAAPSPARDPSLVSAP
jgi:flagellar protein FliO/FliZ